jgi:3'-5' exoribonuclease
MIADLKAGQKITDFFVVRHKEIRTKKDSSETYLSIELGDASGRLFGSFWGDWHDVDAELKVGELVKVRASVIDWHGKPHLSITKIRPICASDDVSLDLFLPTSKKNPSQLFDEYLGFVKQVKNKHLKKVLTAITDNDELVEKMKKAPGGKLWHHCYLGGLLEHSNNVARLVLSIADTYKHVNRDLLLTGALLHDIGKIVEFKWQGFIDYSDTGRLHGHISIGYFYVANAIEKIKDFPSTLRDELLHLILAHQGKLEHGSPVVPMTREAMILNYADELDSKISAFDRIEENEHEPGRVWSNYVKLLDRFLYFGDDTLKK